MVDQAGGDLHDVAAALFLHFRNRQLGDAEEAGKVDPERAGEIGLAVLGEWFCDEDAGVVDQRIDAAEPGHGFPDHALGVNLAGFFRITQLAIAEMEKQGSGHVVQITTSLVDHAIDGVPSVLASLTKGGLNAATKSLAIEYAKRGIRVNAVSPGIIKTPMNPVETHAALGALHPVGHMGEIKDIVDAVLYLEGAGFVTGEILHVDGGQSAGH